MHPPEVKPADLLNAWRDAVRAAELAERLAASAAEAADAADERALASAELAELAEQAAAAAARAAERASATATEAASLAKRLRETGLPAAQRTIDSARGAEAEARSAYHDAENRTRSDSERRPSATGSGTDLAPGAGGAPRACVAQPSLTYRRSPVRGSA